ncbi:protease inhibitor I42 family protein [Chloroflexota bacterium]
MKIKPILMLTIIAVSMFLIACATPSQKAWVEVSCDEFNDNPHINAAPMLEVQVGETFEVKLCSNPSTGFQWTEEAQISDSLIIKQEDHKFIGPESEPPSPPGTPGQEILTFKALQQGSSKIYLEYSRPWEGGEKGEWTCTINVLVKAISASPPVKIEDEKQKTMTLENTVWVLESYGGKGNPLDVIQGSKTTVEFQSADSKITGSGGCNNYFGGYKIDKSKLTIEPPIASTEMACPEPEGILDQEQQYLTILLTAESYQVQDGILQINCGAQILIYTTE